MALMVKTKMTWMSFLLQCLYIYTLITHL